MSINISEQPKYNSLNSQLKSEINEFFNRHIQSLEQEFAYKDTQAIQQYLNDGVFAVQYTRFLNRLSNKIKVDLKKTGKEYLENHFSEHEDYLDVVIRFTKEVDQFYVKQEQLDVRNQAIEIDNREAIVKGVSAGVLTAALTYGLAAFIFRTPFIVSSLASGAFGTVIGGKTFQSIMEENAKKSKQLEKTAIINQVSEGLEACRKLTVTNVTNLLNDYEDMFAKFLKGLDQDAVPTR